MTTRDQFHLFLALLCGFSIAFALLLSLTVFVPLAGQLLPGGDRLMVIDAAAQVESFRRGTLALSSFWFWSGVGVLGTFSALEIWKWMRG